MVSTEMRGLVQECCLLSSSKKLDWILVFRYFVRVRALVCPALCSLESARPEVGSTDNNFGLVDVVVDVANGENTECPKKFNGEGPLVRRAAVLSGPLELRSDENQRIAMKTEARTKPSGTRCRGMRLSQPIRKL